MNIGDLVRKTGRMTNVLTGVGIIVDIDPLKRGGFFNQSHSCFTGGKPTEIVILLNNGVFWHDNPRSWEIY